MQLPEKCKTQFGRKISWFVVVDKRHAHPGKIKLHHNRPNSLANAAHAASEFQKQRLTFLSINIIIKYFALPCKVQKTTKKYIVPRCYSTILQQIQSCAQRRHCCNQNPHAISSCQGNVAHVHRINGSLYFHTPFCYDSHAAWLRKFPTCSTMHCICIHIIRKTIVRIHTRSHLFPAVADVSKIPVYVNYSCDIAVVCVRILIDAERLNSKCQVEITLQRIPCSPVHHKRSSIDSAQSIHTSEFQAHCTKKTSARACNVSKTSSLQRHSNSRWYT